MGNIPYGRQDINQADIDAVISVLRSDFLTQGPAVPAFEKAVAEYTGAHYAIAVNSATSALHIACLALGVGKGDVVWTSPITFVASANCALYCGAKIDFVDINPYTYNICVDRLSEKLAEAERHGELPKVLIPVHLCGQPCDMEAIKALSIQYGFKVIEDASHAIGASYKGKRVGGSDYSDITVFSFHPVKIITTGEGGMAVTKDEQLAKKMRLLRSHGITNLLSEMSPKPSNEIWNYQQIGLGFNYRMTDLQAGLGLSQLSRLDSFVERRNELARNYDEAFKSLPIQTPYLIKDCYSSYHLYAIRIKSNNRGINQQQAYKAMQAANINVNLHYIPVYRQPYYESLGFASGYCPEAEAYFVSSISLPLFSGLEDVQQDYVIHVLQEIFK